MLPHLNPNTSIIRFGAAVQDLLERKLPYYTDLTSASGNCPNLVHVPLCQLQCDRAAYNFQQGLINTAEVLSVQHSGHASTNVPEEIKR
jgi:hypothetical protein